MTFTIGRASFDNNPTAIRQYGDRLSLDINILPSTLVEAKVLRQQVLGLANNADEPVVPLTWDADSDYDGFYRVFGVDVEPVQSYLSNNLMRCRIDLERVGGGSAAALTEVYGVGSTRPTGVSAVTATRRLWFPDAAYDGNNGVTRTTATGDVRESAGLTSGVFTATKLSIAPAHHYDGAATIEVLSGGSWYPVVGRQLPPVSSPQSLRMSNGLIRGTWSSVGNLFTLEHLVSGSWSTVGSFTLAQGAAADTIVPAPQVTALRNDPATVVLSYSADGEVNPVSLSLGRGELFMSFQLGADKTGFSASPTEAATTTTGGLYATNATADGDRWVMASAVAFSTDTSDGFLFNDGGTPEGTPVMLGVDPTGGTDTPGTVIADWWGAVSVSQRVVAR